MSHSHTTPARLRARYLKALNAIPLAAQLTSPIDPARLTVLGTDTIAGRGVTFGTMATAPRLWVTFTNCEPALIGYLTGLIVGEPELWLCEETHRAWVLDGDHTTRLKEAATLVWHTCQRTCDG